MTDQSSLDDISRLLDQMAAGDELAKQQLFRVVYDDLRIRAERLMADQSPAHTLQPTAVVHAAYERLAHAIEAGNVRSRASFFAVASTAMRNLLVDHARRKNAAKRGGGGRRISVEEQTLDYLVAAVEDSSGDLLSLNEALNQLEKLHPRQSKVVELRFFAGCTMAEVAETLNVSLSTIEQDWRVARAFLREMIAG